MTRTTRQTKDTSDDKVLYLAFELSQRQWKLGFSKGPGSKEWIRTIPARELPALAKEMSAARRRFRLRRDVRVVCCYEAGRDGFWLHRFLESEGFESLVVDSASIEVSRRGRRAKSDKLDVKKLLTMLMRYDGGEKDVWSVVRVPTEVEEDNRQLHRELRTLKKDRTRVINRIRGHLAKHGLEIDGSLTDLPAKLEPLRCWGGLGLPTGIRERIGREWVHYELLMDQIRELEAKRRLLFRESTEKSVVVAMRLKELFGIGENFSWVFAMEFFGWRTFRNRREVGSLAGLCPTPYQSGDDRREQGIGKDGNRWVRGSAIELAWAWVRFQPESRLTLWWEKRFSAAGPRARKVGIVALARKLLVELWRWVEWGVVPEGAVLREVAS